MSERVLPEGWVLASIDQVSIKGEQRKPDAAEQFIYVDIGSIDRESKVIASPQRLSGSDAPSRARKVISVGDVLVSLTRPNLNAVALVGKEYDGQIVSTGFEVIRPVGVDSRFVFFLVRGQAFIDAISGRVQGALYPAAKSSDVKGYQFPLPPSEEQKAIADKLDELLAQVNNLKARLDTIPAILKRFRQSVLAAAVSIGLPDPSLSYQSSREGVELGSLLLTSFDGPFGSKLKTSDYTGAGVGVSRLENIRHLWFDGSKKTCISEEKYEELKGNKLEKDDVLFSSFVDEEVRVCLFPYEGYKYINKADCFCLRADREQIVPKFLMFLLASHGSYMQIKAHVQGVTRPRVNLKVLKSLKFKVPGVEEQVEIVRRVDQLFAFADQIEQQVANAQARVDTLTQSILAKAFRGELTAEWRAENPELISGEKSAEALLERIKAEKARPQPAGRGHKRKSRQASLPV